tara:strand:+ start:2957 stop:3154 length:198 start_codon:yes stop_codon:yes gene_type:complete
LKELPWPRGLEVTLEVAGSIGKKMEVEALGASRAAVLLPKVSQTLICSSIFHAFNKRWSVAEEHK